MLPRLFIFAGRFGSGKTECAANFAVQLARGQYLTATGWTQTPPSFNSHPTLVDLDIVTPYFRTRELGETLRPMGVAVVSPAEVGRYLDLPAISPEILGAIEQRGVLVVLDVGGDPQGARALGQYSPYIQRQDHVVYFVVNPYRPFTDTAEGIRAAIREVERTSRLTVSALVSNPNMMDETHAELVLAGHRQVMDAARVVGLPVAMLGVEASLAKAVRREVRDVPILEIRRFFDLRWTR
ncbi:MAG: hypothetical protein QHH80_12270 [Anaerolineae bacterium]|jgi:hypothetical protein|nr:hypothetical protein [Anaerolineae bacterium]